MSWYVYPLLFVITTAGKVTDRMIETVDEGQWIVKDIMSEPLVFYCVRDNYWPSSKLKGLKDDELNQIIFVNENDFYSELRGELNKIPAGTTVEAIAYHTEIVYGNYLPPVAVNIAMPFIPLAIDIFVTVKRVLSRPFEKKYGRDIFINTTAVYSKAHKEYDKDWPAKMMAHEFLHHFGFKHKSGTIMDKTPSGRTIGLKDEDIRAWSDVSYDKKRVKDLYEKYRWLERTNCEGYL